MNYNDFVVWWDFWVPIYTPVYILMINMYIDRLITLAGCLLWAPAEAIYYY